MNNTWEQPYTMNDKTEPVQSFEAFKIWVEMGNKRSLKAVAERLEKSHDTIKKYSCTWKWSERLNDKLTYENKIIHAKQLEVVMTGLNLDETRDIILQTILGNILQGNGKGSGVDQRVVIPEGFQRCLRVVVIVPNELLPCILCRYVIQGGQLISGTDLLTDQIHLLLGNPIVKEYGNGDVAFDLLDSGPEIHQNRIEQTEKEKARNDGTNGCQREQQVPPDIFKALPEGITD